MLETLTQVAADYIREWTLLKVRLVLEREWFYQFAISENVLAKGCLHICKQITKVAFPFLKPFVESFHQA